MKGYRKAIFAVVYFKDKNKIDYLLLKRKLHWKGWEFPKGGIRLLEPKRLCVKREVREETGLPIKKIKNLHFSGKYKYQKLLADRKDKIGQTFSLFAVEAKSKKITRMDKKEHSGFEWMSFKKAYSNLTWPNQKECLKKVNDWLERN